MRYYHYACRTEQTCCQWIMRFIHFFGGKTHPRNLGVRDVERFLSDLAEKRAVSSSTQRQALNAIVFLYREVLDKPLDGKIAHIRAKKTKTVTVLGKEEVSRFFRHIDGTHALMAKLLSWNRAGNKQKTPSSGREAGFGRQQCWTWMPQFLVGHLTIYFFGLYFEVV